MSMDAITGAKTLPLEEKLKVLDKEIRKLYRACKEAGYEPDKIRQTALPVLHAARRGMWKTRAKRTLVVIGLCCLFVGMFYWEPSYYALRVVSKKFMVMILPYYDWTWPFNTEYCVRLTTAETHYIWGLMGIKHRNHFWWNTYGGNTLSAVSVEPIHPLEGATEPRPIVLTLDVSHDKVLTLDVSHDKVLTLDVSHLKARDRNGEQGYWLAQLYGTMELLLQPVKICREACNHIKFNLTRGQMVNVPTDMYAAALRPASDEAVTLGVGYYYS
uniref:Uncharacterized protein n=1 Tax=Ciona savignyi TaxID=51511 RepID=H2Y8D7_CIOSA